MIQGYQILYPVTTRFLVGIWSELFNNLRNLIIADCCNIRIIETKFGAPGNRTPLKIGKPFITNKNSKIINNVPTMYLTQKTQN